MKKLKKILPIIVLALVLIFALMPTDGDVPAASQILDNGAKLIEDVSDILLPEEVSTEARSPEAEQSSPAAEAQSQEAAPEAVLSEDGFYTTRDDVALYIHTYGHLPGNFVTKKEAQNAGWSGGGLDYYMPGMSIGGDRFGNHEGLLPSAKGRTWTECDINTMGASSRGAERIVFSNDGLIYYTGDHYESFTLLYD